MASRTIVLLEDDVDGSKADETIEFGIDGTTYAIDLSNSNATKLRGALDGYINKARKVSGKRSTSRKASSAVDLKAVRACCLQWHRALQPRTCACLGTPAVPERRQLRLANQKNRPVCWAVLSFYAYFLEPGNYFVPRHDPRPTVPIERP